ncbi:hypothetical protein DH09_05155 [Bacillaceae bacterium JMAK1]|nr:hypothetical protein DH09_05155 [Bacillaceae bacterium JMAK1]
MHPLQEQLPPTANQYLEQLALKGRKSSTVRRYAYDIADFYSFIDVTNHTAYTKETLEHFMKHLIQERHYKHKTYKRVYRVLHSYFNHLMHRNVINENPIEHVLLPDEDDEPLTEDDLFTTKEINQLLRSTESIEGLNDDQKQSRPLLAPRNLIMLRLILFYGLRLQELHGLHIDNLLSSNTLFVTPVDGEVNPRKITLQQKDQTLLANYLDVIPKAVRPVHGNEHPLFVAFDFKRQTYRWSYEEDKPKRLTIVAIQKMIREELRRAGIPLGRSAQHMRHTFIVNALGSGRTTKDIQTQLGLHSELVLLRYETLSESMKKAHHL